MPIELPFLTHLELDQDADLAAIRRAYAKKVKQIDAEQQGAQFQALREAYEQAMQWNKQRTATPVVVSEQERRAEVDTVSAPTPAFESAATPDSESATPAGAPAWEDPPVEFRQINPQEVLASFNAFIDTLLVQCLRLPNATLCKREMEARLQEADLVPFEARELFERATTFYLAAGWKPGNDALFMAAIDVFQWNQGKSRLDTFGPVGIRLNRAVTEWSILLRQFEHGDRRNVGLLGRMRNDEPPTEQEMWFYNGALARMMAQVPMVLPIVTNMRNKEPWLVVPQHGVHGHRPQPPTSMPPETYKAPSGRSWAAVLACLPIVIGLAINGMSHRNDYQTPYQPSAPQHTPPVIFNSTSQPSITGGMPILNENNNLQARVAARMQFDIKKVTRQFPTTGLYVAMIGANGDLLSANTMQSSGNPQFDAAALKAIRAAAPFPPEIAGKELKMQYLSLGPLDLP